MTLYPYSCHTWFSISPIPVTFTSSTQVFDWFSSDLPLGLYSWRSLHLFFQRQAQAQQDLMSWAEQGLLRQSSKCQLGYLVIKRRNGDTTHMQCNLQCLQICSKQTTLTDHHAAKIHSKCHEMSNQAESNVFVVWPHVVCSVSDQCTITDDTPNTHISMSRNTERGGNDCTQDHQIFNTNISL